MILAFLLCPAGVLFLCRRVGWLGKIGPVLVLYILGIAVGNIFHPAGMAGIQDALSSAMVPVAIPLMLFGCTFRRSETRSQLLALITGLVAVVTAVICGYLMFGRHLDDGARVGAMLTGVYTGGTVNMAALKTMLEVSDERFVLLNSYDMVVCFLYLTFLMSVGVKLFRKILPCPTLTDGKPASGAAISGQGVAEDGSTVVSFRGLWSKAGLRDLGIQVAFTALIAGASAGLGLLAGDGWFMTVFILGLTTFSIGASFLPVIKGRKYGYESGMYCIYVFSMVVASMADVRSLSLNGELWSLAYLTFVIFGSLLLQVLLARIFKIDSDTMVISSVTYICSPPFVPMMAASMKNRRVLVAGLSIGVIGYAAGNYLGFLIFKLLELL